MSMKLALLMASILETFLTLQAASLQGMYVLVAEVLHAALSVLTAEVAPAASLGKSVVVHPESVKVSSLRCLAATPLQRLLLQHLQLWPEIFLHA